MVSIPVVDAVQLNANGVGKLFLCFQVVGIAQVLNVGNEIDLLRRNVFKLCLFCGLHRERFWGFGLFGEGIFCYQVFQFFAAPFLRAVFNQVFFQLLHFKLPDALYQFNSV